MRLWSRMRCSLTAASLPPHPPLVQGSLRPAALSSVLRRLVNEGSTKDWGHGGVPHCSRIAALSPGTRSTPACRRVDDASTRSDPIDVMHDPGGRARRPRRLPRGLDGHTPSSKLEAVGRPSGTALPNGKSSPQRALHSTHIPYQQHRHRIHTPRPIPGSHGRGPIESERRHCLLCTAFRTPRLRRSLLASSLVVARLDAPADGSGEDADGCSASVGADRLHRDSVQGAGPVRAGGLALRRRDGEVQFERARLASRTPAGMRRSRLDRTRRRYTAPDSYTTNRRAS